MILHRFAFSDEVSPVVKDENRAMTVGECGLRHKRSGIFMGLVLTFVGILIATGAYSALAGARSERRLDVHEGRQEECIENIEDSLERLEKGMEIQRKMIEDLWREKNGD